MRRSCVWRRWIVRLAAAACNVAVAGAQTASAGRSSIELAILAWLREAGTTQLYTVYGVGAALAVLLVMFWRKSSQLSGLETRLQDEMKELRTSMEAQTAEVASKAQAATDKARGKSVQLSTLFLKLKNLVSCTDKETLMKELMAILSKGFGATRCAFFMYDKAKNELFILKASGLSPQLIAQTTVVPGDPTMIGWAAGNLKLCTAEMLSRDNTLKAMKKNRPIDTVICAPVIVKEKLVGVIHIGELRDLEWTEVETQLFWTCCLLTGIGLDKADLIEATRDELVSEKQLSSKSLEERKKMRGLLDKVVSPKVATQLLSQPENLHFEGETREMTVFFSDIKGFTTYSENRDPKDVVHILNEYLTAMTEVVFQFGGTLDKFVGDAIVAHWGALPPDPDHAKLAVRAGYTMRQVLGKLHEKWRAEGKQPLEMGMGIHTGPMVFGGIGSPQKMDFTVIGDNVNLCSRIEGLTRRFNDDLIISEDTYQQCKDITKVRPLGSLPVKGKAKPVTVYEVIEVDMSF
ncbi:MAG: GAF domain-containing protein [Candidatus Wallbacteria bacterium]|nr:GAF domain-containing protein [Candidatus Wallbacteria bacterium]